MNEVVNCRACNRLLDKSPLLSFKNSPTSAQGFLDCLPLENESVSLDIFECIFCGVVQHNLEPVSYYKNVIRAIAFSSEMYDFRMSQLSNWINEHDLQTKNIIEIGSGLGEYQNILTKCGAKNIFGLENSAENVAEANSNGYKIYKGYLDSQFKNPFEIKFDAFVTFSFLEHWPNPSVSFMALHKMLNIDAVGLIEVPNFELILEKGLFTEFTPDHIFYFDITTFTLFLQSNGFEVISVERVWHDYVLSAKVRKKRPLQTGHFLEVKDKLTTQLKQFLSNSNSNVVWGAGHQALAVISMTEIANLIDYVVDSATFKQGKYTPTSHLLIKAPEEMLLKLPDSIVIMAAAYSSEILRVINARFSGIKNIAVLKEDNLELIK